MGEGVGGTPQLKTRWKGGVNAFKKIHEGGYSGDPPPKIWDVRNIAWFFMYPQYKASDGTDIAGGHSKKIRRGSDPAKGGEGGLA